MTEDLAATVRWLKDRQDIYDLIVREARGRDRHDVELTASCYWPDGFDEHGPHITPAPDYPERANAGHALFFAATTHSITSHACEIDADVAHCESYVIGALLTKDEQLCRMATGRYLDRVERRANDSGGAEWRILHRRCTVDTAIEGSAEWLHSPAVAGFLKAVWGREDVSYQRPFTVGSDGVRWGQ